MSSGFVLREAVTLVELTVLYICLYFIIWLEQIDLFLFI